MVQDRSGAAALFNLRDDIGEKTDLATPEPARLKEPQAAYARLRLGLIAESELELFRSKAIDSRR